MKIFFFIEIFRFFFGKVFKSVIEFKNELVVCYLVDINFEKVYLNSVFGDIFIISVKEVYIFKNLFFLKYDVWKILY